MNERIDKLLVKAGAYFGGEGVVYDNFDPKKFAELLVRECMWKIMTRKEEAIDNNWHVDEAMSAALSDISEHFGVEE
jgi:hypothetical protein